MEVLGDCVGRSLGWHRCIFEFSDCVGASEFGEHGLEGSGVVDEIVWVLSVDGLQCRTKFAAKIFACSCFDVCEEDESKLGVVNVYAIGLYRTHFGTQQFHVGLYFLLEIEVESDDAEELLKNIGGAGAIHTLEHCIQQTNFAEGEQAVTGNSGKNHFLPNKCLENLLN